MCHLKVIRPISLTIIERADENIEKTNKTMMLAINACF